MEAPQLSVLLPTYNRPKILTRCIQSLATNLRYSGPVQYLIGNDGQPLDQECKDEIAAISQNVIVFESITGSLGANLNRLISMASGLILQMDDDHILLKPLNLDPHVLFLAGNQGAGWVKLMGIAAHHYIGHLEESYWRIDWNSPELYITSNRPHLKLKSFHGFYGMYEEGLKLGQTEENFCHRCIDLARMNPVHPNVYVPLDVATETSWDHIGDSWQLKGF